MLPCQVDQPFHLISTQRQRGTRGSGMRYRSGGLGIDDGADSTIDEALASCVDPALYVCPAP